MASDPWQAWRCSVCNRHHVVPSLADRCCYDQKFADADDSDDAA